MIPTIKELFKKYSTLYTFEEGNPEYLIDEEDFQNAVIELVKLHVEAALKATSDKFFYPSVKKSLIEAYPLSNIK